MNFLSICSGIEAASVSWNPLGWKSVGFSEIEKFPCAVLAHHYPDTPNYGDMTNFKEWNINESIDLVCGGTPCQSFSVAGLRKGMDDPRGNLMLTFLGIVDRFRPRWVVWENVPGVLSSNRGRDFGTFLGALGELGYGFSYRILDAQYFGVAQRRRRVFVVGYLGDWRPAAAVLFERHSLQRHPAPSREARKEAASVAGTIAASGCGLTRPAGNANELDFCVASYTPSSFANYMEGVGTLKANGGDLGGGSETLIQTFDRQAQSEYGTQDISSSVMARDYKSPSDLVSYAIAENIIGRQPHNGGNGDGFSEDLSYTLNATGVHGVAQVIHGTQDPCVSDIAFAQGRNNGGENVLVQPMAFAQNTRDEVRYVNGDGSLVGALAAEPGMKQTSYIQQAMVVRRLTPTECEFLQGFPRSYTQIPWRNKPVADCPDGPRYKALGNSWAVPVARWIGERIEKVEAILKCAP